MTVYEILKQKEQMGRDVLAAKVNGEVRDLSAQADESDMIVPLSFDDPEGKRVFNHTASHILAQAV